MPLTQTRGVVVVLLPLIIQLLDVLLQVKAPLSKHADQRCGRQLSADAPVVQLLHVAEHVGNEQVQVQALDFEHQRVQGASNGGRGCASAPPPSCKPRRLRGCQAGPGKGRRRRQGHLLDAPGAPLGLPPLGAGKGFCEFRVALQAHSRQAVKRVAHSVQLVPPLQQLGLQLQAGCGVFGGGGEAVWEAELG